jgi:hypothetical protein
MGEKDQNGNKKSASFLAQKVEELFFAPVRHFLRFQALIFPIYVRYFSGMLAGCYPKKLSESTTLIVTEPSFP